MPDPYNPKLNSFNFSEEEKDAIAVALAAKRPWDHDDLADLNVRALLRSIKDKLCDFHTLRQNGTCCYCRMILKGHGSFVRDREHILPKEKFKSLAYEPFNISISCKRCNIEIKGRETDFVVDPSSILNEPENPNRYLIIHPNFECWDDFIKIESVQSGTEYIVLYRLKQDNPKAVFTYNYFNLKEITKLQMQCAQGDESPQSRFRRILQELEEDRGQK